MRFLPHRTTGQRAWWSDVAVGIAIIGTAQAIFLGAEWRLDAFDRRGEGPGREVALVLERGPLTTSAAAVAQPLAVTLAGSVAGLYPGAQVDLPLRVSNPAGVTIDLDRLTITVGTPDREGCPATALTVGAPATLGSGTTTIAQRLAPDTAADLLVPVGMVVGAPSACQGATFPLSFLAEGTLP
jgi:hypothetical protein